ncbi:Trp biosynthesis protein [Humibacillus sp. DSM 29435]|nr:Trp biosynthesis protein [Humibacillus sp. DSM 29435]
MLLPAAVLLGLTTLPWASGRARDVLTSGVIEVSGSTAAPGTVGVALVTIVALLAMMTGGPVIRAVSAGVLVLAAVGTLVLTVAVAVAPVGTVAEAAARQLARTTAPEAVATTTVWAWLAVVMAGLLAVGAVSAGVSSRSWAGLSSRYERAPQPDGDASGSTGAMAPKGPRGQVRTAWDELSEGGDPTLRDGPGPT